MERLGRVEQMLERQAEVIAGVDIKLDQIASLVQDVAVGNAQAKARMDAFDQRLEETRQLVAKNSSDLIQCSAAQEQRSRELDRKLERNVEQIAALRADSAARLRDIKALKEASRTQLAASVGDAKRIDREHKR